MGGRTKGAYLTANLEKILGGGGCPWPPPHPPPTPLPPATTIGCLGDESQEVKRGFSKTSRDRSGDLSTSSRCGEGKSRKRSLGDEKSRRGGKGKHELVSSDLKNV
jgi:hypothetical protein